MLEKINFYSLKVKRGILCGLFLYVAIITHSCVEPYDFEPESFESALVIEGRITDQLANHRVSLSRTFEFEEEGAEAEENASVVVVEAQQRNYLFKEIAPGIYESEEEFRAKSGFEYQLKITTSNGREYASEPTTLTASSTIENVTPTKTKNGEGVSGIVLQVDSGLVPAESPFLLYEYEEDFKIVSPMSSMYDLEIVDDEFILVQKEKEEYICYGNEKSGGINLVNTTLLDQNKIKGHLLTFIPRSDPKIAHRYSILVKQFVISQRAYSYYNTLKDFSQSESLFSQNQPGFLEGNIYSQDNPEESVIGFFNVASESSKRIFFNFLDFYSPSEGGQSFVNNCPVERPDNTTLKALLRAGEVKFLEEANMQPPNEEGAGDYRVAPVYCIDCTVYASNVVPEFWEE